MKLKQTYYLLNAVLIIALSSFHTIALAQEMPKTDMTKEVGKNDSLLSTFYLKSHYSTANLLFAKVDQIMDRDQLGFGLTYRRQIYRSFTQNFMPIYWLSDTSVYITQHVYDDSDISIIHIHQSVARQAEFNNFFSGYIGIGPSLFVPDTALFDLNSQSNSLEIEGGIHLKVGVDIRFMHPKVTWNLEPSIWYGFDSKRYNGTTISSGFGYVF